MRLLLAENTLRWYIKFVPCVWCVVRHPFAAAHKAVERLWVTSPFVACAWWRYWPGRNRLRRGNCLCADSYSAVAEELASGGLRKVVSALYSGHCFYLTAQKNPGLVVARNMEAFFWFARRAVGDDDFFHNETKPERCLWVEIFSFYF